MTALSVESGAAWSRSAPVHAPRRSAAQGSYASVSSLGLVDADFRPVVERSAPWLGAVVERILWLFEAGQVSAGALAAARLVELLSDPIWAFAPRPFVGPVESGGFGAEFRSPSVEVQLEVSDEGDVSVYAHQGGGIEWEGPISDLPDGIEKWAWRLGHGS